MKNDRIIDIAVVGCGRICRAHIEAIINQRHRANLKVICDSDVDKLREIKNVISDSFARAGEISHSVLEYRSYKELLNAFKNKELNLDLVILATPSGLHSKQVIMAANHGLHVCTEKPMATRWSDGLNMVEACDDAAVNLFVVKQNRFSPTLQLLKKQINNGRFGKISLVSSNVFWQRPQSYYDKDNWRGTWEFDGGALMNQASHYVDLIEWLVGPLESVSASTATLGRCIEVEDTAALQFRCRNGALGTMAITMLTYPENLEGSLTILGQNGSVKIGGKAVNKIELWKFSDKHSDDSLINKVSTEINAVYGHGHLAYYDHILDVIEGKAEPICDGRDGLRTLEFLIGSYISARDDKTVHLPLEY